MTHQKHLVVVGAGFAGSITATLAAGLGYHVTLVEKDRHPRFVIGESSSPLANLLLEELAGEFDLPILDQLKSWGHWQRFHPTVGCGLKRGFTFYHHRPGKPFSKTPDRKNELLVAASPHDEVADTHWYRPDFDLLLLSEAVSAGVRYIDHATISEAHVAPGNVRLTLETPTGPCEIQADWLIDASGQRGFATEHLGIRETPFSPFPTTVTAYTHFRDVRRLAWLEEFQNAHEPPYPVDDAAVHHVFSGGWIWVLHFDNGITSAGIVGDPSRLPAGTTRNPEQLWQAALQEYPSIRRQFQGAIPCEPWRHSPVVPFRASSVTGPGFLLLPSAAAFVDPLLSLGFPLALFGIQRLARALRAGILDSDWNVFLDEYQERTGEEIQAAVRILAALYATMDRPPAFNDLTLLYFAAASWSETMRRLGRPEAASSFLLAAHGEFRPGFQAACELAMDPETAPEKLRSAVESAIAPFDVAGLCDRGRKNWYPVLAEDLQAAAQKLGATRAEIAQLLKRSGFKPAKTA